MVVEIEIHAVFVDALDEPLRFEVVDVVARALAEAAEREWEESRGGGTVVVLPSDAPRSRTTYRCGGDTPLLKR